MLVPYPAIIFSRLSHEDITPINMSRSERHGYLLSSSCCPPDQGEPFQDSEDPEGIPLPGIYDYPPGFHYFLAIFPDAFRMQMEKWASAFFDMLHCLVVYFFSLYIFSKAYSSEAVSWTGLWVSLLFMMSPSLTSVGSGPRAYQGTARTPGELLFTLSVACGYIYFIDGVLLFLLLAGFFGGLLLLTSKFAAQVFLFFNLIIFFFSQDLSWLGIPCLAILFALIMSRGHYKEVALGHWDHCQYYRRAISKRFYLVAGKNKLKDIKTLIPDLFRTPGKAAQTILMDNTYLQLIIKNPQLFFLAFIFSPGLSETGGINTVLYIWTGASLLAFFITSLRPFLFLGEAERYLEYALLPQFLLIGTGGFMFPFAYFMICYEIILYGIFAGIFIYIYRQKEKKVPDFEEMASFIGSDERIQKILPVYLNDALRLAYESGKGIAHFPGNFRNRFFPFSEFLFFYEKVYPFPNENLKGLMERYQYDAVCFSSEDIQKANRNGLIYDLEDWTILFSNNAFKVLRPLG